MIFLLANLSRPDSCGELIEKLSPRLRTYIVAGGGGVGIGIDGETGADGERSWG